MQLAPGATGGPEYSTDDVSIVPAAGAGEGAVTLTITFQSDAGACSLVFFVSGSAATAVGGQTCLGPYSGGLLTTILSGTFLLSGSGATLDLSEAVPDPGAPMSSFTGTCT